MRLSLDPSDYFRPYRELLVWLLFRTVRTNAVQRDNRPISWDAMCDLRDTPTTQALTLKTNGHADVCFSPMAAGYETLKASRECVLTP